MISLLSVSFINSRQHFSVFIRIHLPSFFLDTQFIAYIPYMYTYIYIYMYIYIYISFVSCGGPCHFNAIKAGIESEKRESQTLLRPRLLPPAVRPVPSLSGSVPSPVVSSRTAQKDRSKSPPCLAPRLSIPLSPLCLAPGLARAFRHPFRPRPLRASSPRAAPPPRLLPRHHTFPPRPATPLPPPNSTLLTLLTRYISEYIYIFFS